MIQWEREEIGLIGHIRMIGFIKKYIWSILIVGFVVFSLTPTFYELRRAGDVQSNRSFELVHNFPTDYNFYLSRIRQGLEGRWTVVEKYTSEPHGGSFIHHMYVGMGQVGRFLRVPWGRAGDVYHVARIVLAITLLRMIAAFCKRSFAPTTAEVGISSFSRRQGPDRASVHTSSAARAVTALEMKRLPAPWIYLAFLLAVTASSWPKLVYVEGVARFGGYMPWWSVVDSLQRITFIPHILAGQALIIFLVIELTSLRSLTVFKDGKSVIFLGLLGFALGMIFPPGLIFVYSVMGVYALLQGKEMKKWIAPYVGFVCVSMPAIAYLFLMTSVYPWKRLAEFDTIHPLPFNYLEYIKALGSLLPLGLMGLIVALGKKEKVMMTAVAWVVAWIALLWVFKFIPAQSPLRFSEMLPTVPLGVLTAYLFYRISILGHLGNLGHLIKAIPMLLIIVGLFHMYSSWLWQKDFVDHKIRAGIPLVPTGSYVMYPLKDFVSAIGYIGDNSRRDAIILSETTAGNYIPVYSGNTVYVGHDNTVHAEQKKELVKQFFSGTMTAESARAWLEKEHITMVFFGPQEREDLSARVGGGVVDFTSIYPFLTPTYTNAHVTIYAIQ